MTAGSGRPDDLLLVEDSPGDLRLVNEVISDAHPETTLHAVSTGEQALDFVTQRGEYDTAPDPDVILLDWHLPKMDGEDVLRELNAEVPRVPVVVMAETRAKTEDIKTKSVTADAYLTKPSNPEEYVEAICSVH